MIAAILAALASIGKALAAFFSWLGQQRLLEAGQGESEGAAAARQLEELKRADAARDKAAPNSTIGNVLLVRVIIVHLHRGPISGRNGLDKGQPHKFPGGALGDQRLPCQQGPLPGAEVCTARLAPHHYRLHPPERPGNVGEIARTFLLIRCYWLQSSGVTDPSGGGGHGPVRVTS